MRKRKRKSSTDPNNQLVDLCTRWLDAIFTGNTELASKLRNEAEPLLQKHPELKGKLHPKSKKVYFNWQSFVSYQHRESLDQALTEYEKAIKAGDRDEILKAAKALENKWQKHTGSGFPTSQPCWDRTSRNYFRLAQLPITIRYNKDNPEKWPDEKIQNAITTVKK